MNISDNCINWFEIPVENMYRAKQFYQGIFGIEMNEQTIMGVQMAFFLPNMAMEKWEVH